ncbi:MAG TPA: hypothetical protein VEK15_02405 [Vicinamibacteria bacterium]|nr:hypothetical protein [Vicinamibacteria bacterium]
MESAKGEARKRGTTASTLRLDRFGPVLFDSEGVLTASAGLHAAARKRTFDP